MGRSWSGRVVQSTKQTVLGRGARGTCVLIQQAAVVDTSHLSGGAVGRMDRVGFVALATRPKSFQTVNHPVLDSHTQLANVCCHFVVRQSRLIQ